MPDTYDLKKITDFTAKAAAVNGDLFLVGDNGTANLRRISFEAITSTIRSMYGLNDLQRDMVGTGSFDANDISDGWHQIDGASAVSNLPVTGRKIGIIFQTSNTVANGTKYQLYAAAGGNELWQRTYWYGTWYAWQPIYSGKVTASVTSGSYGMSSAKFVRHGQEVMVQFGGTPSGLTTGWKQAIQIPTAFIPTESRTPYATCVPQNGGFQPFLVTATSAGYIEINPTYAQVTGFVNAQYIYYID